MRYKSLLITLAVLAVFFLANLFFPASIGFLVPALLLFVPLLVMPPVVGAVGFLPVILATLFLDRTAKEALRSVGQFVLWVLLVFPPYLVCAHFWMLWVVGFKGFTAAPLSVFTSTIVYQVLMVAFPEEFFFRGYLQTALNKIWLPKWRLFGADLGWGWIITSLVFAFAHSVIQLKWWHFSIFFPALLFGYLRERCGSITAPIFFHAFSNSFMTWFAAGYF